MFSLRSMPLGRFVFKNTLIRSKTRFTVGCKIEESINEDLENEVYKPKDHPGKVRFGRPIEIPSHIQKSIERETDDGKVSKYIEEGIKLDQYLFSRHVNMEQKEVYAERKKIQRQLQADQKVLKEKSLWKGEIISDETETQARKELSATVSTIFYKHNYNWKPIEFTEATAWAYLYGRSAKEYAIILKIFTEIAKRDPEFKPRSLFDFGAGVGTGTWAASQLWEKSIFEYFCVDKSSEMNDLSDLILRKAKTDKTGHVFYRQFLPASYEAKYHIVLSAFSLMELENLEARLEILNTLWKKCDGYFVVIENGTNAGFQLVEEARTFILSQKDFESEAYLFSPCPHENPCPRIVADDGTPCNFSVCYHPFRIGKMKSSNDHKARFSYVVFKKGSRSDDRTIDWPRLVRQTQVRGCHTHCRLCTHLGELRQIVITKRKHSKYTYRCARKSVVGDRFPVVFDQDAFVPPDMEIPDEEDPE